MGLQKLEWNFLVESSEILSLIDISKSFDQENRDTDYEGTFKKMEEIVNTKKVFLYYIGGSQNNFEFKYVE